MASPSIWAKLLQNCHPALRAPHAHLQRRSYLGLLTYLGDPSCSLGPKTPMGHQVSNRASPASRLVQLPHVGGLHHRYEWNNVACT